MPIKNGIKGLTGSNRGRVRVSRRVSIGEKHPQKGYPIKLDHFQFRMKDRDGFTWKKDERAHHLVGKEPRTIEIELLSDDPNKVFRSELAAFKSGRKLFCYGDGEVASRLDEASGRRDEITCAYGDCPIFQRKKCKPHGRLLFACPEVGGGVFDFQTTSYSTIGAIDEKLRTLGALTGGVLAGVPVQMTVSPEKVKVKETGKTVLIYVVDLQWNRDYALAAAREVADLRRHSWSQRDGGLSAPRLADIDPKDLEGFADEFHPDEVAEDSYNEKLSQIYDRAAPSNPDAEPERPEPVRASPLSQSSPAPALPPTEAQIEAEESDEACWIDEMPELDMPEPPEGFPY